MVAQRRSDEIRAHVTSTVTMFVDSQSGLVHKRDVPTLYRYLRRFATDDDVDREIRLEVCRHVLPLAHISVSSSARIAFNPNVWRAF